MNRIRAVSLFKRILNAILLLVILLLSLLIAVWTAVNVRALHELLAHLSDVPAFCLSLYYPEELDLPTIRISMYLRVVAMGLVSLIPLALSARLLIRSDRLSLLNISRLREYALTFVLVVVCGFLVLSLSGGIVGSFSCWIFFGM